jgi:uncharacterized Zn finger protein
MDQMLDCPLCASSELEVVAVEYENRLALAVHCKECGAFGHRRTASTQSTPCSPGISAWDG